MTQSPFVLSRFEYEPRHLYYLPRDVFAQLENPKPTYVIGTRGTGKTTLLQALHWNERLTNRTLAQQLSSSPFAGRYIGLYIKLPDTQLQLVDEWLRTEAAVQRAIVIGSFLDLLWLELLLDALAEMVVGEHLFASAAAESQCVEDTLTVFSHWYPTRDIAETPRARTFKELAKVFRGRRRQIERHAFSGGRPSDAMTGLPVEQVGRFGRSIAAPLAAFCAKADPTSEGPWHFKVCMDEAEVLNDFQVRVLNTMIRLSETPVFHVVSFVAAPQSLNHTLIPDLTLSDADRQLVVLDLMTEPSFRELAEGVTNVRIQTQLDSGSAGFNLRTTLGPLDINGLLTSILETSVDPKAKQLLEAAREYQAAGTFVATTGEDQVGDDSSDRAPIYQAYLVQELRLRVPTAGSQWKRRNEDSAKFRKRMVAAYLSICHWLGADVRYASADMVVHMSDRCIRDFLAFMHEVFVEAQMDLPGFIVRRIPSDIQNAAIRRASQSKREAIAERGVAAPTETGRLIDALARITHILQTESAGGQHLRASERGVFSLPLGKDDNQHFGRLLELITDAGETGFLRLLESEGSCWRFRVHKSLAPAYQFSYRGAYYPCRILPHELSALLKIQDQRQFHTQVNTLGRKLAGLMPPDAYDADEEKGQGMLF